MPDTPVLGRAVTGSLDAADIDLMPVAGIVTVDIDSEEVQAVCPVTGQPDIYAMRITYTTEPPTGVIESKALKMYLTRWRDVGITCEDLAVTIANDLAGRLGLPVTVTLRQQVRGGLTLTAQADGYPTEGVTR